MPTLTNRLNLPNFYVKAVEYWSKHHDSQADYSVTELLAPPRQKALERTHADEIVRDVSEFTKAIIGSGTHMALEGRDQECVYEERMFLEFDGIRISGAPDVYDPRNKTVYDTKTLSAWEVAHGLKIEKEQQLNCYSLMEREHGNEVENLVAFCMIRDWRKAELLRDRDGNYPPFDVVEYPVRVWGDDETESFIRDRIAKHEDAKKSLPYCTPEEQLRKAATWAVYKEGNVTASRVTPTEYDAEQWIEWTLSKWDEAKASGKQSGKRPVFRIEYRRAEAVRCESFCSVNKFCTQYEVMVK